MTNLGTNISFRIVDMRGKGGFPKGREGLVYEHLERRTLKNKYTGFPIKRDEQYVIRTSTQSKGWRIDRIALLTGPEAISAPDRTSSWETPQIAAVALETFLKAME